MRSALETTSALMRNGPELTMPKDDKPVSETGLSIGEETMREEMQRHQAQLRERLASVAAQWEHRVGALEQALNRGLETAVSATSAMNERMTKFVRLAEVLETAVERSITTSKDVAHLSRKVLTIEDDVACLAQELATDKADRSKAQSLHMKQAEAQVTNLCNTVRDELRQVQHIGAGLMQAAGGAGGGQEQRPPLPGDMDRLAWELSEERAERRRLAQELHSTTADTELIRGTLDTTNEHLVRLSREIGYLAKGAANDREEARQAGTSPLGKQDLLGSVRPGTSSRKAYRSPGVTGRSQSRHTTFGRIDEEPQTLQSDTGSDATELEGSSWSAHLADGADGSAGDSAPLPRGWGGGSTSPGSASEKSLEGGSDSGGSSGGTLFKSMGRFMGRSTH